MNVKMKVDSGALNGKAYRAPGLGLMERLIVWGGTNGKACGILLLGAACFCAYDAAERSGFTRIDLSSLRVDISAAGAAICILPAVFLLAVSGSWRSLGIFLQAGIPMSEARERLNRLDPQSLEESLNDVARDFAREHAAEVDAWRQQISDIINAQLMGNEQLKARLQLTLTPEAVAAILDNRTALARAMLSGGTPLMQLGHLFRLTGHVYNKQKSMRIDV